MHYLFQHTNVENFYAFHPASDFQPEFEMFHTALLPGCWASLRVASQPPL